MAINVGSLLISLGIESGEFKSGLSNAEKEFKRSTKRIEAIGNSMGKIGQKLSLAVTAPLVALGVVSVKAAAESRDAMGQVESALNSMGSAAGRTKEQLQGLATGLMRKSLFDDDEILRKVTANLLTFGNVAGAQFDRAQQAAVDLAARLGQDLQSSAIQVGKALNDPVKGITALSRVGVSFTAQQKEQIEAMVKAGNAAAAQSLILKELERQYGGSAEAALQSAGPLAQLRKQYDEITETIGTVLLTALERVAPYIQRLADAFLNLSPGVQTALVAIAGLAVVLGPLLVVIGSLVTTIAPLIAGLKLAATVGVATGGAMGGLTGAMVGLRAATLSLTASLLPYAVALGAIAAVIYVVASRTTAAEAANRAYTKGQKSAAAVTQSAAQAADKLAGAHGKARVEALALARAEAQNIKQKLASARASLVLAEAEAARQVANRPSSKESSGSAVGLIARGTRGLSNLLFPDSARPPAADKADELRGKIDAYRKAIAGIAARIDAAELPVVSAVGGGDKDKNKPNGSKGSKGPSGPSAAEIQKRFNDELTGYASQALSAMASLAANADDRAEYELRGVELARLRTLERIKSDQDYSALQKARLSQQVEVLADFEREQIERNRLIDAEHNAADLAQVEYDRQREMLGFQANLADTQAERKRVAMEVLALEQEYRRNQLEMVVASKTASDAEKRRAQAILYSLGAIEAGENASASRANETDVERYLRTLSKSPAQINEAIDAIKINGLEALSDALVDAIVNFKSLADVAKSMVKQVLAEFLKLQIQQAIIKPLSKALGLTIPAHANGTNFAPGGISLVGERGPELVNLRRGSQVIPNNALRGMAGRSGQNITVNVNAKDAVLTQTVAGWVQQGVSAAIGGGEARAVRQRKWALA